ncbi:MAG: glycosyltransferase [Caldilineaceae bacterium]
MDNALISVVIPNYNHGQYLGDAIESVLAQTYHRYEIIVVDDGSTDDSRAVAARFGDRVRYLYQANQGLSVARNTGINAAQGDYIALLDADDCYEAAFMTTMRQTLAANPQAAGVYCGYRFVDQENRPLPQVEKRLISADQLHAMLLQGNFWVPESALIHRRCYDMAGPFDEALRACEDWDMWLRITAQHTIVGVDAVLTRHRVLAGSMSSSPERMVQNRFAVLHKHLGPLPTPISTATMSQRTAYAQANLLSAIEYLQIHQEERAYAHLYQAAQIHPPLFTQVSTFYELGCGGQPKGWRGDLRNLNLAENERVLLYLLGRLLEDGPPPLPFALYAQRWQIYAAAHFALGLLYYNTGNSGAARRQFWQSFLYQPWLSVQRRFATMMVRSLLGAQTIQWLKQRTGAAA